METAVEARWGKGPIITAKLKITNHNVPQVRAPIESCMQYFVVSVATFDCIDYI